jgi:hypothetical protein
MIAYMVAKQYSDPVISGIRAVCVVGKWQGEVKISSPYLADITFL